MFHQLKGSFYGVYIPDDVVIYDARHDPSLFEHNASQYAMAEFNLTKDKFAVDWENTNYNLFYNNDKLQMHLQKMIDSYQRWKQRHEKGEDYAKPAFILIQNYGITFCAESPRKKGD